jgi:hypothetical protein
MKLEKTDDMCAITKMVVDDFNALSNEEFFCRYSCSKKTYYKRVKKYGDPYMRAPLAKIGKFLNKLFA